MVNIRKIGLNDGPAWLDLVQNCFGPDYPDKQVYDPIWVAGEILSEAGGETWVAEANGRLEATVSFLIPLGSGASAICNLGRHFCRRESFGNGAAAALLSRVNEIIHQRQQAGVSRVLASDNLSQNLYESYGYSCIGFQPLKHLLQTRQGVLFYYRKSGQELQHRTPLSDSLSQVAELGAAVLSRLNLRNPAPVKDGVTGYPLQGDLSFAEASLDDFQEAKRILASQNFPLQVSGSYNQGSGFFRNSRGYTGKSLLGLKDNNTVAGLAYTIDPVDRAIRIIDTFSMEEGSIGALMQQAVKLAQEKLNSVYVEMDVMLTAPRLLKTAEQLGFVPIAFIPSAVPRSDGASDVAKLVKLNAIYDLDGSQFTAASRGIVSLIDLNFQDQKVGVAIINLLRGLPFFEGLGDGELRKIARLFTQKLFRPGEKIFARGDQGNEAYVVMRGQIDILLNENTPPLISMGNGQIFGELAFLDGSPRTAMAVAKQASILLVIQRSAFNALVQQEPHLGMVVMRNIALELSNRLRKTNEALKK